MDAKRIIPQIQVHRGQVTPATSGTSSAAAWARGMELAGADEVLFLESEPFDRAWVLEVADTLFIPFTVGCANEKDEDLAELLEAGADAVLLKAQAADLPRLAARFGRKALRVAVALSWDAAQGWRAPDGQDALAWLTELGQAGAGALQVAIEEAQLPGLAELCESTARLSMPILVQVASWAQGQEALLHGADGVAYPAGLGAPTEGKAMLEAAGLAIRR